MTAEELEEFVAYITKRNMASSEQNTNFATSGWWTRSPDTYAKYISPYDTTASNGRTPPTPLRFIRFEDTKHRNIFGSSLRGVDISDKVKLKAQGTSSQRFIRKNYDVSSNKSDDYHTEEIDEFLSEFRVYKEEGGIA